MKNKDVIVAEYDYYTLEQARRIFEEERKLKRKESIDAYMSAASMVVIPVLFVLHWIVFGY